MDSFVAMLHSKTKLMLLYGIIEKVDDMLRSHKPNTKVSEENIAPLDIKLLLQDVDNVLAIKNNFNGGNIDVEELNEKIHHSEHQLISAIRVISSSVNKLASNYASEKIRELVVVDTKFLLESVAKFLAIIHEAEEEKFESVCSKLSHSLSVLKNTSIEHLKTGQQEVFFLVKEFFTLLDYRVKDMTNKESYHQLATHLNEFKRLFCTLCRVGMFMMANPESKLFSWAFVIRELEFCIEKIIQISKRTYIREDNKEIGQFVNKIDQLLHLLSLSQNTEVRNLPIDALIKDVLNFSMGVSHMSNTSTQQEIMQCCQQVMYHHDIYADLLEDVQADPYNTKLRDLFTSKNEILIQSIERLESIVNIAVLQLMAEKFPQMTGHFLKAINSFRIKEKNDDSKCSSAAIINFFEQADHLYQVCKFAVACSTDHQVAYQVLTTIESLENLDPEITPTVAAFKQNPECKSIHFHLSLIKQLWRSQIDSLMNDIIAITDVTALLSVLRLFVAKKMDEAIQSMKTEKIEYIIECANFIISTISISKGYNANDEVLQERINKLRIATASTKSLCCTMNSPAASCTMNSPRKVRKHIKILVHCIGKLCDHAKQLINPLSKQEELTQQEERTRINDDSTPIPSCVKQEQISVNLCSESNDIASVSKETGVLKGHFISEANSMLQIDITAVLEQLQTQLSCFTFENISCEVSHDVNEALSVKNKDNSSPASKNGSNESVVESQKNISLTEEDDKQYRSESIVIERLRAEESKSDTSMIELSVTDLELETTSSSNEPLASGSTHEPQDLTHLTLEENEITSCCSSLAKVWNCLNVEIERAESCTDKMYIDQHISTAKDISELSMKLIASTETRKIDHDIYYSLAKAIATKGELIAKFIIDFSSKISDKRIYTEFHNLCQRLALLCHQLRVVSSVGANVENKEINAAVLKSVENVLKEVMSILSLQMMALGKLSARSVVNSIEIVTRPSRSKVFQSVH